MKKITFPLVLLLSVVCVPFAAVKGQEVIKNNAKPEKITDGYEFTEGPLWHSSGYLLFSDIPANTIYKWTPGEKAVKYMKPSGHSNGLAFDLQGRLLLAQHDGAIARYSNGQQINTVVDSYKGKRLNSPNDLAVRSDGAIYFTDPPFGVSEENKELSVNGVYRYTKDEGLQLLVKDFERPNGIAFSPDETKLYINDTQHNHIRVFAVNKDGTLGEGKIFAKMEGDEAGSADGMKVDTEGNLYSTGPGGLWIFSPDGKLLQQVDTPRITNLAWGGPENSTLFLTSPNAVYKLETSQKGS